MTLPRLLLLAFLLGARTAAGAEGCPAPAADAEPDEWEAQRQWQAIEGAGYRLGRVDIDVTDVYESSEAWYAGLANWAHIETKDKVVRQMLLVKPDQPVEARVVYETARRLRKLGFFRSVSILPLACHDGVVDARIEVKDAWTLNFSVTANQVGGETATGIKLMDRNFLGTGKEIYISSQQDAQRSSVEYSYYDRAVFGSLWQFAMKHLDASDGQTNGVEFGRPFRSAGQVWGFYGAAEDRTETLSFHQYGEIAWQADVTSELRIANLSRLITRSDDSGWRAGVGVRSETRSYGPAIALDPTLRPSPDLAPFASDGITLLVSRFHDHYASFSNLKLVNKTEDYNLGLDATLALTFEPETFSSGDLEGARVALESSWAARPREGWLTEVELDAGARNAQDAWRDGRVSAMVANYAQSGRHTRLARLKLDWRDDPDPEHEAILGGDEGMLGYPANWVVGDRMMKLHLEDRWLTDQVLFQTLRVGYAVIGEVGRGRRFGGDWSKTLANVGGGFRLGNLRGAYGQVLYFTVFVPLVKEPGVESYQVVIGDVISF